MKEIIVKLNEAINMYKKLQKAHPLVAYVFDSLIEMCEKKKRDYINDPNAK